MTRETITEKTGFAVIGIIFSTIFLCICLSVFYLFVFPFLELIFNYIEVAVLQFSGQCSALLDR